MSRLNCRAWLLASAMLPLVALAAPSANGATETVLYSFQFNEVDGYQPYSSLTNFQGKLYGTTLYGGAYGYTGYVCGNFGCGTIFSIDPTTGAESVAYSFNYADGTSSSGPVAGLTKVKGSLYGGGGGGVYGEGTVFSFKPKTGKETDLHSFGANGDGNGVWDNLVEVNGTLYGTTLGGGAYNGGTLFSFDPMTGAETVLYSFQPNGIDGYWPYSALTYLNGKLYGTTSQGGPYNCGTVFSFDPTTGAETVLYSFGVNRSDGFYPYSGLTYYKKTAKLYGTTQQGGTYGGGEVFSIDPTTGTESAVHAFGATNSGDGSWPHSGLVAIKGNLYGTTQQGGTYGAGTVYSLNPKTGAESVVYAFQNNGADGVYPQADLINLNGTLYGTTPTGGAYGDGTVFSIVP